MYIENYLQSSFNKSLNFHCVYSVIYLLSIVSTLYFVDIHIRLLNQLLFSTWSKFSVFTSPL